MTKNENTKKAIATKGPAGFALFVAYLGAATYFVHQSVGFGGFLWALLKAIVWPGIVIYHVFTALHV